VKPAMILPGWSFDEMREDVESVLAEWCEDVVPRHVELLPNNRYSPVYAWMFSYEKRLKYRIEDVIGRPLDRTEAAIFGADGAFSEALSNAFVHGHQRDPGLPIEVRCCVGTRGLAFAIRDRGEGFDVERVVRAAARGGGYFSFAGNGLRALSHHPEVAACYENGGRMLLLRVGLTGQIVRGR